LEKSGGRSGGRSADHGIISRQFLEKPGGRSGGRGAHHDNFAVLFWKMMERRGREAHTMVVRERIFGKTRSQGD